MLLEFNSSFSFMGFPDSPKLITAEKDLHATECNFLSRPSKEFQEVCQIAQSNERAVAGFDQEPAQEAHDDERNLRKEEGASSGVLFASSLKVKLPEVREQVIMEEEDDGLATPTSLDHKIPIQVCPPAPRKPKSVPSNHKGCRRRAFLDLSNEVESLFPAAILADFGKKIKKVRKESVIT